MNHETLKLLVENGIVMAAIIVSALLLAASAIGVCAFYFTKKDLDGSFALKKHKKSLEAELLTHQQKELIQLGGAIDVSVLEKK